MTVRPSLNSAPKPIAISLKREPWMNVPLVEPWSRSTHLVALPAPPSGACATRSCRVSTSSHSGDDPKETGLPGRNCTDFAAVRAR